MSIKPSQEPSVQAYVYLIRSAESLHAQVSRGLVVEGLTASQFSAMKALRVHGKLAQRDIAKYILKSGGNTTVLLDNLENDGLVTRERDTEDRRVVYVSLTREGEAVFDRIYPGHLDRIRDAMSELDENEAELLTSLLKRICGEEVLAACTLHPTPSLR